MRCIQWFKDTNLKANHNLYSCCFFINVAVFNGSKILIWKQITTGSSLLLNLLRCIQWFKDTNLKANHNSCPGLWLHPSAVFNGSKILIWKQITTLDSLYIIPISCIQWFKDTNLKANHNNWKDYETKVTAVFNGSKILIWKQITTGCYFFNARFGCIQWFKDTNLKANHNFLLLWNYFLLLYSMVQRY